MVYWRTDVRGASLLYGAVAYLLLARTIPVWLAPSWMPMLLVLGGLALNLNPVPDPIKYSVGSIFFAVALMLMQRAPAKVIVALENRWLVLIGTWSYSLYLWQQPFAMSTSSLGLHMALLPAAFGVALVSFYCVEQPARRFLNGLLHARRSVITEPPEIVEARRP
jgi:peptidoglycan/LPS O-acetylase OafA/YrhL